MMLIRSFHRPPPPRGDLDSPSKGGTTRFAATLLLAAIVAAPWASQQASAHSYWPKKPKITFVDLRNEGDEGGPINVANVCQPVHTPPPPYSFLENDRLGQIRLNWCKAKKGLASNWSSDDRDLDMKTVCDGSPRWSGSGEVMSTDGSNGTKCYQTDDPYRFWDGNYIFRINFHVWGPHHGGGAHPGHWLFVADVVDE